MFAAHPIRLGVVGTGFIARGLVALCSARADWRVTGMLTRRPVSQVRCPRPELVTRSLDQLIEGCDVVVECSGTVRHAAEAVRAAHAAGKPVVTMNSEFHATVGSHFVGSGMLTEAEGDQSGSLAALEEEVREMGFEPKIFGNTKGFLNLHPTAEEMGYWAERQGIRVEQVTAFTDGTKVQIEQALVANGLGGTIVQPGLLGPRVETVAEGVERLWEKVESLDRPCADYVVTSQWPGSIFISATHSAADPAALRYFKMGPGPLHTMVRPYHLCFLEIGKTLTRLRQGRGPLLNNSERPRVSVAAIAKCDIPRGTRLERGIGSFQVRGESVLLGDDPEHVPIGLLEDARITTRLEAGQPVRRGDVELPDSLALEAWRAIQARAVDWDREDSGMRTSERELAGTPGAV
ncbi:MAG: NAD(P)-dependent oxidoreductase [Verrucomicrobiales bacterium]